MVALITVNKQPIESHRLVIRLIYCGHEKQTKRKMYIKFVLILQGTVEILRQHVLWMKSL